MEKNSNKSKILAYAAIIAVIFIWGVIPTVKKALIGEHFSSAVYTYMTTFAGALSLLAIFAKNLKKITLDYFAVAFPTGLVVGVAAILQAIAYKFDASPTNQAFLENLSCLVVPVLLFIILKKKPSALTVAACAVCLAASFVLTGMLSSGLSFSTADILNAIAGILYGINIAITGIYAKKFDAPMYVMLQLFVQSGISVAAALSFNQISINGSIIDHVVFTPSLPLILAVVGIGILTNSVCWTMRTSAMKYVSANVVAVIMPFSAVVTGVVSVALGMDKLSWTLIVGAVLGLVAGLMSGVADTLEEKKEGAKSCALKDKEE